MNLILVFGFAAVCLSGVIADKKCKVPEKLERAIKTGPDYAPPGGSSSDSNSNGDSNSDDSDNKSANKNKPKRGGYGCACNQPAKITVYDSVGRQIANKEGCSICTNGQAPQVDTDFCSKYPKTKACRRDSQQQFQECGLKVEIYSCCVAPSPAEPAKPVAPVDAPYPEEAITTTSATTLATEDTTTGDAPP